MERNQRLRVCISSCFHLKFCLIWPVRGEEFNPSKRFYYSAAFFLLGPFLMIMVLMSMHVMRLFKVGGNIIHDLAVFVSTFQMGCSMLLYLAQQKKIVVLLQELSDFQKFGKPPGFDEMNGKLEFFTKGVGIYACSICVIYTLFDIQQIPECKRVSKIDEICGIIYPSWSPFKVNEWILHVVAVFVLLVTVGVNPILACQNLQISCNIRLRIRHLNSLLLVCFHGNPEEDRKRLRNCIQYHDFIIRCATTFDESIRRLMFSFLVSLSAICALVLNGFLKHPNLGSFLHISGWLPHIFMNCISGQILADSSFSVTEAAFGSRWYDADIPLRKNLILIIMRSQKLLYLTTGGFGVIDLPLFLAIMKMSYSILTVFQ